MNTATTSQITEADVLAFFQAIKPSLAAKFPELNTVHPSVDIGTLKFQVGGFAEDHSYMSGYGTTFDDACAELRKKLGTPETKAAKLREEAAKMLAEADRITGT